MMTARWWTGWLVMWLALAGCDPTGDNYIKGSLAATHDMGFDETRARLYESELSIEYVENLKQGEKVVLRLTVSRRKGELAKGDVYDLTSDGDIARGQGFDSTLPDLESGELELLDYSPEDGSDVRGSFEAVFITTEKTRKTLRGGFSAPLEVIAF